MKVKLFLLLISLSISCINIKAQQSNSDKLIFGGDIGFGISDNNWNIAISPQVGYKLTKKFHIGAGITYLHEQSRNSIYYDYKENSVGLNLFTHYYPWKKMVFRAKPEIMYTWYKYNWDIQTETGYFTERYSKDKFVPAVIVGGGVHLRPIMLLLNYELIQDKYSSYSDNIFLSIGFMF